MKFNLYNSAGCHLGCLTKEELLADIRCKTLSHGDKIVVVEDEKDEEDGQKTTS